MSQKKLPDCIFQDLPNVPEKVTRLHLPRSAKFPQKATRLYLPRSVECPRKSLKLHLPRSAKCPRKRYQTVSSKICRMSQKKLPDCIFQDLPNVPKKLPDCIFQELSNTFLFRIGILVAVHQDWTQKFLHSCCNGGEKSCDDVGAYLFVEVGANIVLINLFLSHDRWLQAASQTIKASLPWSSKDKLSNPCSQKLPNAYWTYRQVRHLHHSSKLNYWNVATHLTLFPYQFSDNCKKKCWQHRYLEHSHINCKLLWQHKIHSNYCLFTLI